MLKRGLLVCLSALVILSTGCAQLKQLRAQNESLREQLKMSQQQLQKAEDEKAVLMSDRQALEAELTATKKEAAQAQQIVSDLQRERMRLEQQRQDLQKLLNTTVETRDGTNVVVYESDILFAPGKAELTDEAKASLDKIAQYLVNHPEQEVRVAGHTDAVPITHSNWIDNYHLSVMRAHAVMRYLVDRGVSAERMTIVGSGPNEPRVEPEEPNQPVAENRRVEILLVPPSNASLGDQIRRFGR